LAVTADDWSTSCPGHFAPGESIPWIGGWVNPRTSLDDVKKRKLKFRYQFLNTKPFRMFTGLGSLEVCATHCAEDIPVSRSTYKRPTTDHVLPHQWPECNQSFYLVTYGKSDVH
jgi:hypothetical protein